jgi:hypothetical protein
MQKSAQASKWGKFNAKAAYEEHKGEEIYLSQGGDLPAGIEMGVAKVVMCKIDTFKTGENKGEDYFMAQAVVVEPAAYAGMRTSCNSGPEALCDTPTAKGKKKTFGDHLGSVLNELRKLGMGEAVDNMTDVESELKNEICPAVEKAGLYIRFRTWGGEPSAEYPTPRVNHDWRGLVPDYVEGATNSVNDNTGTVATATTTAPVKKATVAKPTTQSTESQPSASVKKAAVKKVTQPKLEDLSVDELGVISDDDSDARQADAQIIVKTKAIEVGIDEGTIENIESWVALAELVNNPPAQADDAEEDLSALGAAADEEFNNEQEGDNCGRLRELAGGAGIDPDAYPTWIELATAISEAGSAGSSTEEEAITPQVGEVYLYTWTDTKTKLKGKKPSQCEVIKLDEAKQTCSLKNLGNNQITQNVLWTDLQS